MADDQDDVQAAKVNFPVIPRAHWWSLRERFRKSIPTVVDSRYIASALGMAEKSAKVNVIPSLKVLGLIGDDLKPTPLATQWRDDGHYAEVCQRIVQKVYPQSLRDVASDPIADKESARRWFASHGSGEALVTKVLSVYTMLLEADVAKAGDGPKREPTDPNRQKPKPKPKPEPARKADEDEKPPEQHAPVRRSPLSGAATIHLNVQIHISPEVSADQIDAIFSSMAKHLKSMSE